MSHAETLNYILKDREFDSSDKYVIMAGSEAEIFGRMFPLLLLFQILGLTFGHCSEICTEIIGQVFGLSQQELSDTVVTLNGGVSPRTATVDYFGRYVFSEMRVGEYILTVEHPNKRFDDYYILIKEDRGRLRIYPSLHNSLVARKRVFLNRIWHKPFSERFDTYYDFNISFFRLILQPYVVFPMVFFNLFCLPTALTNRARHNRRVSLNIRRNLQWDEPKQSELDYLKSRAYTYQLTLQTQYPDYSRLPIHQGRDSDFFSPFMRAIGTASVNWGKTYNFINV